MKNTMAKMLVPLVKQHLTNEKVAVFFREATNSYPIAEGAVKNIVVLTDKEGIVHVTIASVDSNNQINKLHKQYPLVQLVSELLTNI